VGKGHLATPGLSTAIPTTMIHFITFLALVVGGILGVMKPVAAGVLAGLTVLDLRSAGVDVFQRRQTTGSGQVPSQCESFCDPINAMLATVSDIICTAKNSHSDFFRLAHPLNAAWPLSRSDISIVSSASALQQM